MRAERQVTRLAVIGAVTLAAAYGFPGAAGAMHAEDESAPIRPGERRVTQDQPPAPPADLPRWRVHEAEVGSSTWVDISAPTLDNVWVISEGDVENGRGSRVARWDGERWAEDRSAQFWAHTISAAGEDNRTRGCLGRR